METLDDILIIQNIAQIIVQEPDAHALSARLTEKLGQIFASPQVIIGAVQENQLLAQQIYQDHQLKLVQQTYALDDEPLAWVAAYKQIYCGNSDNDEPLMIAPVLNHQDNLLAMIICQRHIQAEPFTNEDMLRLQTIALMVASAFERTQMFNKMVEWNDSFQNLLAFNAALNASVSTDILLQRLVEHAAGFLGADAGFVALLQDDVMQTEYYLHDNTWSSLQRMWLAPSIPAWVRQNDCPYLNNEYSSDPLADDALLRQFEIHNALCVPILNSQDITIGCICLHNKYGGNEPFTWADVAFLESLSHSTALVLDNTRLLNELEQQRIQLKALAARNIDLLEEERQRIARELHDEAGQILIGIKLGLQVLRHKMPPDRTDLQEEIDALRNHVNDSTQQLKSIAYALRPPTLDKLGLEAALRQLTSEFMNRCHIVIDYTVNTPIIRLSPDIETACYRIVQEALTNVARHAKATFIDVTLDCNSSLLEILIQDNGRGFIPATSKATGLGLLGMQERAITLGGKLEIASQLGHGTCLKVKIPCSGGKSQ